MVSFVLKWNNFRRTLKWNVGRFLFSGYLFTWWTGHDETTWINSCLRLYVLWSLISRGFPWFACGLITSTFKSLLNFTDFSGRDNQKINDDLDLKWKFCMIFTVSLYCSGSEGDSSIAVRNLIFVERFRRSVPALSWKWSLFI